MYGRTGLLLAAIVMAAPLSGRAGGGPQNVLVVVNQNSEASMALGNYYRETRGIPLFNVFAVDVDVTNDYMDTSTFSNQVRNPILAYITDAGLSNQIDYIVFSRDIPYRVHFGAFSGRLHSSVTSSMFYGFKYSPNAFQEGCDLADGSEHDYFLSERAFTHDDTGHYISTMLNASTEDDVRRQIDRSAEAEGFEFTGNMYFVHDTDLARAVRNAQYEPTQFALRFLDTPVDGRIREIGSTETRTNTMGYTIGRSAVGGVAGFNLQKGSLAEHLTSWGGRLFDSPQMSITNWISRGAAGSYGTVVEPCAYTNKFPQIDLYYWYARGFNLGESFYMSVQNPYQGIVLGDPLTQPYARPPTVEMSGVSAYEIVSGVITVEVSGVAVHDPQRVDQLDLFLNDRSLVTLTNVPPQVGNKVTVLIDSEEREYIVSANDTIHDVAAGLANSINFAPPIPYTATARGDRVEIVQDTLGVEGISLGFSATAEIGSGNELSIHAHAAGDHFLETTASYLKTLRIEGTAADNDLIRVVVERLDGAIFTNEVVASGASSATNMMVQLMDTINADTNLQVCTGVEMRQYARSGTNRAQAAFIARTNSWMGYKPDITVEIFSSGLSEATGSGRTNDDVMGARATLFLSAGRTNLTAFYELDTTLLPDGPHTLRAVAYCGSALRTQGHALLPFAVNNHGGTNAVTIPDQQENIALSSPQTTTVHVAYSGTITAMQFFVQGRLIDESDGEGPWTFEWDPAAYGAGLIELYAVAFADDGAVIQGPATTVRVFMDSDDDGIPDWWEYKHFGGSTNAVASADDDDDGATNLEEYIADTDPHDPDSVFRIAQPEVKAEGEIETLSFLSATTRLYQVEYSDESLTNYAAWTAAHPIPFRGDPDETVWSVTNAPPATNTFRFFRVETIVP